MTPAHRHPLRSLCFILFLPVLLLTPVLAADYDPAPLAARLADAGEKAPAIVVEEVRAHPKELAQIVMVAVPSVPKQASLIVRALLKAFPKEFAVVVKAAILGQPELAKQLTEAALAEIPEKSADILKEALTVTPDDLQNEVAGAQPPPAAPSPAATAFPVQPIRPDSISPSQ